MGLLDSIKNILAIPDDDYEDEAEEVVKEEPKRKLEFSETSKRSEPAPRVLAGKSKTVSFNAPQMQVILVKPDRYDDVTSIADHMVERKTIVLNLESADRDLSRRIVDFLSGAAYALGGNMRKVSRATFILVPDGVDMMGDLILEEFEDNKIYF